jgi:pilus assembly protein Flp/PilA
VIQYLNILLNGRLAKMEERGATAVEYGLLVALIAIIIIGAVTFLGGNLSDLFNKVGSSVKGSTPAAG